MKNLRCTERDREMEACGVEVKWPELWIEVLSTPYLSNLLN